MSTDCCYERVIGDNVALEVASVIILATQLHCMCQTKWCRRLNDVIGYNAALDVYGNAVICDNAASED
eukprot:9488607-Pyramimonas_sp.AAC.1